MDKLIKVEVNQAQAKLIYDLAFNQWSELAKQSLTKQVDKKLTQLEDILNLFYIER